MAFPVNRISYHNTLIRFKYELKKVAPEVTVTKNEHPDWYYGFDFKLGDVTMTIEAGHRIEEFCDYNDDMAGETVDWVVSELHKNQKPEVDQLDESQNGCTGGLSGGL